MRRFVQLLMRKNRAIYSENPMAGRTVTRSVIREWNFPCQQIGNLILQKPVFLVGILDDCRICIDCVQPPEKIGNCLFIYDLSVQDIATKLQ